MKKFPVSVIAVMAGLLLLSVGCSSHKHRYDPPPRPVPGGAPRDASPYRPLAAPPAPARERRPTAGELRREQRRKAVEPLRPEPQFRILPR